jgi:hypothetical protein
MFGNGRLRNAALLAALVLALPFWGCTIRVPVRADVGTISVSSRLPVEAALFISEDTLYRVFEGNPEGMAYGARPHQFPLGSALEEASLQAFSQVFERLEPVRTQEDAARYPVVIAPEITEFRFSYPNLGLASAASIKVRASLSAGGNQIWVREASPPEQRRGMGVDEVGRAASEALSAALKQLAREMAGDQQLKNALKSPVAAAKAAQVPDKKKEEGFSASRQPAGLPAPVPKKADVGEGSAPVPEGVGRSRYDVAVLIANRSYSRPGIPEVEFAERDMAEMKRYVTRTMGFDPENIIEEKNATKGTLETLFGTKERPEGKIYNWVRPKESRLFIYYVGHGAPGQESGEAFFVPSDADPDYIETTGYPVGLFYSNLKKIPAKETVVVLDTCFSGQTPKGLLFKRVSPAMLKVVQPQSGMEKGVVMASAGADQLSTWYESKQHSLFTYFFIKGLGGEADLNKDKKVSAGEMETYLADNVPFMARKLSGRNQQPMVEGNKDIILVEFK